MDRDELNKILESHKKWLRDEEGGERADLTNADLIKADLRGATLRGAALRGAKIKSDIKLLEQNPIIQISPIGSENGELIIFNTEKGLYFSRGCSKELSEKEFLEKVKNKHGDNEYAKQYLNVINFAKEHFKTQKENK